MSPLFSSAPAVRLALTAALQRQTGSPLPKHPQDRLRSPFLFSVASLLTLAGVPPAYSQTIDGGAVVSVPGTHTSPWTIAGSLSVGNTSSGTLNINAGGSVSSGSGFIGRQAGSTGTVTVSGAGAQWTTGPGLNIGNIGTGTLDISNGGRVTSTTNTYLGVAAGSSGTLRISGTGSQLNTTGFMRVGQTGHGAMQITDGAVVTNGLGYVGYDTTGIGVATVSGAGSQWNSSAELSVGTMGKGQLIISNGGAVSSTLGTIGSTASATGSVTVDGTGSSWTNSSTLTVGHGGSGALTISNNAVVTAASARAGVTAGSQGVINIGAAATDAAAAPGSLVLTSASPSVTLGSTGSLVFNHTDASGGYLFTPVISGAGRVGVYSGTTVLTGDNTYTGDTTIQGGILQLGNGGTSGSIAGNVLDNAILKFDRSNSMTVAGLISGSGTVEQAGAGTTILTANNVYTGGTTISSGTLQLGNGGATGAIVGDVANNGTLVVDRSDTLTLAGAVSGTGAVHQDGAGTTILTGGNTYTGGTTISAGTLQLGNGGATGSIMGDVTDNGRLVFNRSDTLTFAGAISGTGAVAHTGTGTTVLTADHSYAGGTTISAGTLQLGNGGTTGSIVGDVTDNGTLAFDRSDTATFAGLISGTGGVEQQGAGTTVLTADHSYTGGTRISAGTLQLGNGGTTGSIVGDVTDNGRLVFNRSDTLTFAGAISGTGAVEQHGAGTTILTADSSYAGGTTISSGVLQLGDGGATGAIMGDVLNQGALVFNRADAVTFAGVVSGAGEVRQIGAGVTVLTAHNTYGGATSVEAGVLRAGTPAAFSPSSAMTVAAAGTLDLNGYSQAVAGLSNAGRISMGTGTSPGTTLTTPNYVGHDGTIALNTYLGADGSPSDRLVIDGGAASGTSTLLVENAGGPGAVTTGNGIRVVDAIHGATTAAGAFALGNPGGYIAAGPYAYRLFRAGVDGNGQQNWYLRSTVDCASAPSHPACPQPDPEPDPNPNPDPNPAPGPTPPAPPDYRPEVSAAVATPTLALRYGDALLDSLHERMGEERMFRPGIASDAAPLAWGRAIGVTGKRDAGQAGIYGSKGPDYDYRVYALQTGVDLYQRQAPSGSIDRAGTYVAFGRASADVTHAGGRDAGDAQLDGLSLGGYWTHIGKDGWYTDAIIQGTKYHVDNARSPSGFDVRTRGHGLGASLEGGYPFRLNDEWVIEPQAQLSYQKINLNDANDGVARVRFSDVDSLRGRVGVRVARMVELDSSGQNRRVATTWLRASLVNEFLANPATAFSSQGGEVPFRADMRGISAQFNLGADVGVKRNVSLYGSVGSEVSLRGEGHSLNGKFGVKIAF